MHTDVTLHSFLIIQKFFSLNVIKHENVGNFPFFIAHISLVNVLSTLQHFSPTGTNLYMCDITLLELPVTIYRVFNNGCLATNFCAY